MGIGSMMAGGNPADGREERDLYRTPTEAVLALLKAETFAPVVWEPACADGRIVHPFEAAGHRVIASDIYPLGVGKMVDFLAVPPRPFKGDIVTNPPFDLAEAFIRHALAFKPGKLALLLKATYWHAKNRLPVFDEIPPRSNYPLSWRLDFKDLGRPTMECCWFVWDSTHTGKTFYERPLERPIALPLTKAKFPRSSKRASAITTASVSAD